MSDENQGITLPRVTNGPKHIWLMYGDIESDAAHAEVCASGDVGWCDAPQFASDAMYVRSDSADADLQRAVLAERERCARVCEQTDDEGEGPDCWGWHAKDYARAIRMA